MRDTDQIYFQTFPWNRAGFWLLGFLGFGLILLIVFRQFPLIDIGTSDLFFTEKPCSNAADEKRCGRFDFVVDPFWREIREIGLLLPRALMVLVCLHFTWILMFKRDKTLAQLSVPLVAILSGLLGPALIVNGLLKELWGRPRPFVTQPFGGEHPFVLPGDITSYCETNCSFVSGEATAAFWMLVLVFYFTSMRSRAGFGILLLLTAIAISGLRVVFGRHFLSDVSIAAIVAISTILFSMWLVQTPFIRKYLEKFLVFSNRTAFGKSN